MRDSPPLLMQKDFKMRGGSNTKPKIDESTELPTGTSTVTDSQPELFDDESMQNPKGKVWYVVLQRGTYDPQNAYNLPKIDNIWLWAHTKSRARWLAKKALSEGMNVIDIFPGTKAHITHKFRGLK